jgi:hypothetical protein
MGRFIFLDKTELNLEDWIIPRHYLWYDQREKPWPNELFPFGLEIKAFDVQHDHRQVMIRRWIDQGCRGDVALEKCYSETSLVWNLWFQYQDDMDSTNLFLSNLLSEAPK